MSFVPWDTRVTHIPNCSNLDSFVEFITPTVPSQLIAKKGEMLPRPNGCLVPKEDEIVRGYHLEDLWDSFLEWSAFGTGVPIVLGYDDTVVQYYNPTLSAMQIFTVKSFYPNRKNVYGKNVVNYDEYSQGDVNESDKTSKSVSNSTGVPSSSTIIDNVVASISNMRINQFGHLYMQYNEVIGPYDRVPLVDKINELSQVYPGLQKFKSTDLTPYSWISISWYPIYHIPVSRNIKALNASFLTYHQFSQPFRGMQSCTSIPEAEKKKNEKGKEKVLEHGEEEAGKKIMNVKEAEVVLQRLRRIKKDEIVLPPFGMTTYKLNGPLWIKPGTNDHEKRLAYEGAAFNWVTQLGFGHNDFTFFMSRRF